MSKFQRVTISAMTDDELILATVNGSEYRWPRTAKDSVLSHAAVGDELLLTLTSSHSILNELMTSSDDQTPEAITQVKNTVSEDAGTS